MSKIFVEKMEHVPGIYILFNLESKKTYIGKATRLKERALRHVTHLYSNSHNNKNLQFEFTHENYTYYLGILCELKNLERLDEWESIYYLAACEVCSSENVYNQKKLYKAKKQVEQINIAKNEIADALLRKPDCARGNMYNNCCGMKDWIDSKTINTLELKSISIEQMLINKEIDFLLFGKAGDYIGKDGVSQTFTSILTEKVNQLKGAENECCLWATSGPELNDFLNYISLYKKIYGNNKKLFVIFKLTVNKYTQNDKKEITYYLEKNGKIYFDTSPNKKSAKALILNNFYVTEDDFEIESLAKMYYRFSPARYRSATQKHELNSGNLTRQTLYPAILKNLILDEHNEELKDALGFMKSPYLLDELKEQYEAEKDDNIFFHNDEEHPAYYLVAEVENYVKLKRYD